MTSDRAIRRQIDRLIGKPLEGVVYRTLPMFLAAASCSPKVTGEKLREYEALLEQAKARDVGMYVAFEDEFLSVWTCTRCNRKRERYFEWGTVTAWGKTRVPDLAPLHDCVDGALGLVKLSPSPALYKRLAYRNALALAQQQWRQARESKLSETG